MKGKGLLHFYGFGTENQHELENRIPSSNGSFIWMDSCTDKHLSHEIKTNTQTLDGKAWGYFLHKVWQRSTKTGGPRGDVHPLRKQCHVLHLVY